jgi:prefoldin subunit 5
MTMNLEMQKRIAREIEQCAARLQYLEHHASGLGREASQLKRRLQMLEVIQASATIKAIG